MKDNYRMKRSKLTLITSLLCAFTLHSLLPAIGCSFGNEPYFTFSTHPDFPLKDYAAGKLGVVQPGYARSYLLVAHRYFSGQPLSATEQQAVVALWDKRLTEVYQPSETDTAVWLKARGTVPGATKIESIQTDKSVSDDEPWQMFCNCQSSAFQKAAETLNGLVGKFGAGSPEVKEWLNAQDKVFTNCGNASYGEKPKQAAIPAPLPANADPLLQKHRAYQIAAANFYAQKFAPAIKEFQAIATDSQSPWKDIAGYLEVRSMIRQASLVKQTDKNGLQQAQKLLRSLIDKPEYAKLREDLNLLNDYISARLSPEQHLQELAKLPLSTRVAGEITKTIDLIAPSSEDSSTGEAIAVKYSAVPAALKKTDVLDWIMTFQSTDASAATHAVERWKQTHSVPWLVAAARLVDSNSPDAAAIAEEASKHQSSPAKWTLFEDMNRINIEKGKTEAARTALDKVLSAPPADLPLSSLNELKTQRLPLSKSLEEFLRFGAQTPAGVIVTGGTEEVPDNVADLEKGKLEKTPVIFTPETGYVLDNKLPLRSLRQVAQNKDLPTNLKNNVAWTSFVRAILIDDDAMARSLAQVMKPYNKAREKLIDAYLTAATPEDRKFAAVFMILQFSSGQPNPSWGVLMDDSYGDSSGWWWSAKPIATDFAEEVEKIEPAFLSAADKAQAKAEIAKLAKAATAPNYLTRAVLSRAKTNPADPRIAQALHLAVKSTRYGTTDDATTALSKQAFTLLHSKFKTSTWAKQTPYWY